MNRMKRALAILALLGIFGFLSGAPASAAMPPPSYPTEQIKGYARDVTGYNYPIRLGFYDSVSDKGFGKDKIYYKHNIRTIGAIQFVLRSPHLTYEGNDVKYTAYANKLKCNAARTKCVVEASYKVWGIATKVSTATWYGEKVGGVLGVKTAYCLGVIRCPSWATGALDGTLKPSTLSATSFDSSAESTSAPSDEADTTEPSADDSSSLLLGSYEPVEEGASLTMDEIEEIDGELR